VPLVKAPPPPELPFSPPAPPTLATMPAATAPSPPPPAGPPPLATASDLHLAARELLTAAERTDRSSRELLTRTDALVQSFTRAADRFARQTRHETLSAVLLAALVAAAAAVLATLLTLAVMAPKIGFLGVLRALFRHG
jgi:hypothetical protein